MEEILSFNGFVNTAVKIVTAKYPDAKLYEADGTSSTGPTTDPNKINRLRVVFQNSNNTTVTITSTSWGKFAEPVFIAHPWAEDIVIKWPINMDFPKANELKNAAGFTNPYTAVTLRNPLAPVKGNPYFIFGNDLKQPYIYVDTVTGKVHQGN